MLEKQGIDETEQGKLNRGAAKHILRTRDQLLRLVGAHSRPKAGEEAFLRSLLAAYPDRVARRREPGSRRGVMVGGRGVRLADEVALADEELFLCIDVDAAAGEALVRQASAIERHWLPEDRLKSATVVEFDEASGKVTARRRVTFEDLVLEESQAALPSSEEVAAALAAAAAVRLDQALPNDNAAIMGFRVRVRCLASWMPELKLPALDDEQLRQLLPQLAAGRRSLAELREAPWLEAMKGLFTWQQLQAIEREAPERIEAPSGSRIAVQYEPDRPPVLAVRIQEVFGMRE
ncbi:MAG: ATP-dependent helicase HrpB, partial [Planctomycetia bacterium]|nr:ATP-dependent helicase HrpB [Planctomycetia bacterium]